MPALFLDTSVLVRLYDRREPGGPRLARRLRPGHRHRLLIARVARVEFASAFQRKLRTGEMPAAAALRALARFQRQRQERYEELPVSDDVLDLAEQLLARHTLRAYDAVQLASALWIGREMAAMNVGLRFLTVDQNQANAAMVEGLDVELVD